MRGSSWIETKLNWVGFARKRIACLNRTRTRNAGLGDTSGGNSICKCQVHVRSDFPYARPRENLGETSITRICSFSSCLRIGQLRKLNRIADRSFELLEQSVSTVQSSSALKENEKAFFRACQKKAFTRAYLRS